MTQEACLEVVSRRCMSRQRLSRRCPRTRLSMHVYSRCGISGQSLWQQGRALRYLDGQGLQTHGSESSCQEAKRLPRHRCR